MRIPGMVLLLTTNMCCCVYAQQGEPPSDGAEEVVVVGSRDLLALRRQLQDAERSAYEVFNRFNDDRRFEISCGERQATGTVFRTQLCQPAFVREAAAEHGRAYWESLRAFMDTSTQDKSPPQTPVPYEMRIKLQERAYQQKMQQIAVEQPEFFEALKIYAESKQQYEQAIGTSRK